jgi:EipB-like
MDHSVTIVSRTMRGLVACGLAIVLAQAGEAATMAPHRAVYDLEMARSSQKARLDSAAGRLAYELTGSECEGWNANFRLVNQFNYRESPSRLVDMQSVTWESGDGTELNYSQKEFHDGKIAEERRVSVKRTAPAAAGEGKVELPVSKQFALPAEALFPTRHQLKIIGAAKEGATTDKSLFFDGSKDGNTVEVLTTIGKRTTGGALRDQGNIAAERLKGFTSWPVNMGYYPSDKPNAEVPDFQMNFDMYENGVATNLLLDYGDVVLRGTLISLELLDPEKCP